MKQKSLIKYLWKELRPYQKHVIVAKAKHSECLVIMWCGTGKTMTFHVSIINDQHNVTVIVFPTLVLVEQYEKDYMNSEKFKKYMKNYELLQYNTSTNGNKKKKHVLKFMAGRYKKIIAVTYASIGDFANLCIKNNIKIDKIIYDEAHSILSDTVKKVVFDSKFKKIIKKIEFYTATPKGDMEDGMCGHVTYRYLYLRAVKEGYARAFNVQLSICSDKEKYDKKYDYVFCAIIKHCLSGKYNYYNVMTFHGFVNDSDKIEKSAVNVFASKKNVKRFKFLFGKIQDEMFPHTKKKFKRENVIFKKYTDREGRSILKKFDKEVKGRIFVLASCRKISQGVDTKYANMIVPIDPTNSFIQELQKIGRVTRPLKETNSKYKENIGLSSVLLLPLQVEYDKYSDCKNDVERDAMIKTEMNDKRSNYTSVLNFASVLLNQNKQDRELVELLKNYPNKYSPDEVTDNLEKNGLEIKDRKGSFIEKIEEITSEDYNKLQEEDEKKTIEKIAEELERPIEIYTQDMDDHIENYNEDCDKDPIRLMRDENNMYSLIKPKKKKDKRKKKINKPPRKKLFDIDISDKVKSLWRLTDNSLKSFTNGFGVGVLEHVLEDNRPENGQSKEEKNINKIKELYLDIDDNEWMTVTEVYKKEKEYFDSFNGDIKGNNRGIVSSHFTKTLYNNGKGILERRKCQKKGSKCKFEFRLKKKERSKLSSNDQNKPVSIPEGDGAGEQKQQSDFQQFQKKFHSWGSDKIHKEIKKDPSEIIAYRKMCKKQLDPTKDVIGMINNLRGRHKKVVVDMGCGEAQIAKHFKGNKKFKIHSLDHYAGKNKCVTVCNMRRTKLETGCADIVIMCRSFSWGSKKDRKSYLKEAHRLLDPQGIFIIVEGSKWINKDPDKLKNILVENGFRINNDETQEKKYVYYKCTKKIGFFDEN